MGLEEMKKEYPGKNKQLQIKRYTTRGIKQTNRKLKR
jgi:hypothetical protein